MEDPPDCKYKKICKWYEGKTLWGDGCYEVLCWKAKELDGIINFSNLEGKLENNNI